MASLPLVSEGELIGAVSIYANELEAYGEEHIRLLETISKIAAEAIFKSQQHAEAKAHALTDPMTGLPNARSLHLQFEKEVGRTGRSGLSFQVVMLDLDGFKAVNDNFGHLVGDEMLREVAKVISGQLREYDFLSRYGGDEFVALIPEAGPDDVAELCARIEKAVSAFKLPLDDGIYASVGVSLGAAGYPTDGVAFDQIIVAADKEMYLRKSSHRQNRSDGRGDLQFQLSEMLDHTIEVEVLGDDPAGRDSNEGFIVELDESAVIGTISMN
jgi:diguanylate cyclase (GGDEF)-like protein